MHFLSPIWFVALAALSVPVMIHLWNVKQGKTLKVGSISLITEASKSNRRSFKLLDLLLLALRCLLLAILAAFLASPVWQQYKSAQKVKGWVLIPKEGFVPTYTHFKPQIDSLTRLGYEFHFFSTGFIKQDLPELMKDQLPENLQGKDTLNYWALIKQLADTVSHQLPVALFTPNGINHFKGNRPTTALNLNWQTYTVADSVNRWIASAAFTNTNTIKLSLGNGSPAGIYYTNQIINNGGSGEISVDVDKGQPFVSLKNNPQGRIAVDTSTLRIAIYTDKYAVDANYLQAALSAATGFSGRKTIIQRYNNPAQIKRNLSWLFWLSDKPISEQLSRDSKNVFKYKPGKAVDVTTWIKPDDNYNRVIAGNLITMHRLVASKPTNQKVWQDGFGRTVLGLDGNTYHFYSHFNPLWNDLVWSDDFPKLILKLIAGQPKPLPAQYDKRILSDAQLQPIRVKSTEVRSSQSPAAQTDLSGYFWLALVVLFISERILSHQKTKQANG